ncbi:MAG TPA: trehalose-6-phosphate synthase [Acidobacteriaceae bacterium]
MPFFRIRLILALVVGITLVSVVSTYFDVLAHKHVLRKELERRSGWVGSSLQPRIEQAVATGRIDAIYNALIALHRPDQELGLAVYSPAGRLLAAVGPDDVYKALPPEPVDKSVRKGTEIAAFGHSDERQWLEDAFPLQESGQLNGVLVVLEDASFIHSEGNGVWKRSFWRIAAFVLLIVGVTLLMVRWFLMRPMMRAAERLRRVRMGHAGDGEDQHIDELKLFTPLAREMETMAESLLEARARAEAEARLRDAGEHLWTGERLAVHVRERFGSSRIFVVSNREPYMHVRQGWETVCLVPPSGMVTAIEPVLRACDGVWVAHGSGSEDPVVVDEFDRIRVPPDDPRYTLRRVWLSSEEESGYYDGFANEGLWPLCHIAHTRPIFRASDWDAYQRVNERFAAALIEEMDGAANPIVFVQDYHFALLPRLIKAARPDARVAIFWHIPWPNPESFGICPWQAELLDGLLGADLLGFHIPLHCNNFLDTVDRVLEARTDREHMTVRRHGHTSTVRPYPVSVVADGMRREGPALTRDATGVGSQAHARRILLDEFNLRAETLAVGVDRLDYTKGIVERLTAMELLLENHPWHRERLTLVQVAAPSRTRIPSYIDLKRQVEETSERINRRFETARWKPIVLIERQLNHEQVERWYRAADVCLVTSLHDGMNLVAKEFLASRDDDDGVLVLSKFTGAAIELRDALLVNPYDTTGVAEAIHEALEMSRGDRRMRMERMRRHLLEHNVYRWAAEILGDLRELRMDDADPPNMGVVGPSAVSPPDRANRKLA